MPDTHRIRPFDGSEADVDAMVTILAESYRVLDLDFLRTGVGFERDVWRRHILDPQTEWILLCASHGRPAGFAGWRYLPAMSHLHALFVAASDQRRGHARAMLHYHWWAAHSRQPDIELLTLHVREQATWAQRLYEDEGYVYYQVGDEVLRPALKAWIENCRRNASWPLPDRKRLMYRTPR
jgi:ribosomal protein S18 acetylase RimI-like enzyme